ncbi:hypothetical protein [Hyphomicrobium sp.]|uniref:hypothetical protein n=1 Tax=Hyphomicrobium sp. TaxID=82 RepID=UPI002BA94C5B|nr:hypothetical protein [Hyphomicrobium sp.]HRN89403.1 hypothetical protein [Hyphomicrobium sp.]HRQ25349.1 hypothetical protein [Hyphomicrobium sp.]
MELVSQERGQLLDLLRRDLLFTTRDPLLTLGNVLPEPLDLETDKAFLLQRRRRQPAFSPSAVGILLDDLAGQSVTPPANCEPAMLDTIAVREANQLATKR